MVRIPPTTQLARDRIEVGVDESSGTRELWVFDPLLVGPAAHGGPMTLQVWRRDTSGTFRRVYAGEVRRTGPLRRARGMGREVFFS